MATAYRKLYVNWITKLLQAGEQDDTPVVLPDFSKYESAPFEIAIVEPHPTFPNRFNRVDISNLTLKASVNDTLDDASPLAEQSTWTKDTDANTFSAELDLNTSGINSAVGTAVSVTAYFQLTAIDAAGGRRVLYQEQVNITNSVIQPTTTSPDPTKSYPTWDEAYGVFMVATNRPGVQIAVRSPSGLKIRYFGVDDNGTKIDDVEDYIP